MLEERKLVFDQLFISLFSGSGAMFILISCLQDFALIYFLHAYNVRLLFDYYCMFNQYTVLFLQLHFIYSNLRRCLLSVLDFNA